MRYLTSFIEADLSQKMVLLSGPRQCGKTTLAKDILSRSSGRYFNWDNENDRRAILKRAWDDTDRLLVFDELHKRPRWKQWLKGEYDVDGAGHSYLVTGSARLDVYRRGGDSMLGRYFHYRLHPFTLDEFPAEGLTLESAFQRLMTVGGFPEPFLDGRARFARRWAQERHSRVLREDIRDLEQIRSTQTVSLLVELLRSRAGGQVVASNLATDLQVSPVTVKSWLELLERMYLVFQVRPYVKGLARAIHKAPKVYFFDNADVEGDEGVIFENVIATHLYKWLQFRQDVEGRKYDLFYVRDRDGNEVDFVVTLGSKILALVEAKWSDEGISKSLLHFGQRLSPAHLFQVLGRTSKQRVSQGVNIVPATHFLQHPELIFGPLEID